MAIAPFAISLMNPFPKRSVRRLLTAPVRRQFQFLQCSSIIRITDKALREELVTLTGGQKHVAQAAEFWVFCADFNRHLQICPDAQLGTAEQLLLGVVDTAMMAQNALTAAESLGLGGYISAACAIILKR